MKQATVIAAGAFVSVWTASLLVASAPVSAASVLAANPSVYNWSGCYFGATTGGLWADKNWGAFTAAGHSENGPGGDVSASGWLFGGQVGCNMQVGPWVFGGQLDEAWSNARGSNVESLTGLFSPPISDTSRVTSLGSATVRTGYGFDRFLPYIKGGLAWDTSRFQEVGQFISSSVVDDSRTGWTIGAGVEYAVTHNLTAFAEYDFYDFGSKAESFVFPNVSFYNNSRSISETNNVVKIGVNWKVDLGQ
jgi:outer membrane immunogenic protein